MLYGALLGKPLKKRRNCQDVWCIAFQLMYRYRRELFPQKQCHRLWQRFVNLLYQDYSYCSVVDFLAIQLADFKDSSHGVACLAPAEFILVAEGQSCIVAGPCSLSSSLLYTLVRPSVSSVLRLKEPSSFNYSKTHTRYQHNCWFGVTVSLRSTFNLA